MLVDIFIPCIIDQVYPETGMNMVKILERLNISVNYNTNQTCCGQMSFNNGYWDDAKAIGEKFIRDFSNDRYIVCPSASCVGMVKNYYPLLFHNTALHNEYKILRKNIFEFTDFLVNVLNVSKVGAKFEKVVTYHEACAARREYGLTNQPRILLRNVQGLELRELKEIETCCGFGGTFSVKHEPIATSMAEQKIKQALDTEAEYIVSTEASCLMHLQGYINKNNKPIKTMHIVDVLAQGY